MGGNRCQMVERGYRRPVIRACRRASARVVPVDVARIAFACIHTDNMVTETDTTSAWGAGQRVRPTVISSRESASANAMRATSTGTTRADARHARMTWARNATAAYRKTTCRRPGRGSALPRANSEYHAHNHLVTGCITCRGRLR